MPLQSKPDCLIKTDVTSIIGAITCYYTGPDPDIAPLGGTNFGEGSRGLSRPLWVQGKALVGGSGGEAPRSKTVFSILNGLGMLSFIMFLAYFSIFRVLRNASNPHICM